MSAWFRTFLRRHLVDGDPRPEYSQLDNLDHLNGTDMVDQPEPGAILAAIEARLVDSESGHSAGESGQSTRDLSYLLALVREQAARLDAMKDLADKLATSSAAEDQEIAEDIRSALEDEVV